MKSEKPFVSRAKPHNEHYELPAHPAERHSIQRLRPALDGLSQRQRAVLAWVANGASNEEISSRLLIGVKTVEGELTHIFKALRVQSRIDAAVIWTLYSTPSSERPPTLPTALPHPQTRELPHESLPS